jgi:hypothetical protein
VLFQNMGIVMLQFTASSLRLPVDITTPGSPPNSGELIPPGKSIFPECFDSECVSYTLAEPDHIWHCSCAPEKTDDESVVERQQPGNRTAGWMA